MLKVSEVPQRGGSEEPDVPCRAGGQGPAHHWGHVGAASPSLPPLSSPCAALGICVFCTKET